LPTAFTGCRPDVRGRTGVGRGLGATGGAWAIVVHGGAGDGPSGASGPQAADYEAGCRRAIQVGSQALRSGLGALDAVERAVRVLEDDPLFNAGTGACLNAAGLVELDAAIMEGSGLRAGAVCALPPFRNPIAIARAALDDGRTGASSASPARR
jgi:beta-aspartyl-peptidase (threonine type)